MIGAQLAVYEDGKGYFIRFTMSDHDVKLECVKENTMADTITEQETDLWIFLFAAQAFH